MTLIVPPSASAALATAPALRRQPVQDQRAQLGSGTDDGGAIG